MRKIPKPGAFLIIENIYLALEALRDRAARSLLTIGGVFIGVVIIIGVASVLNGFREGIVKEFETYGADTIYVTRMPVMMMKRPSKDIRRTGDVLRGIPGDVCCLKVSDEGNSHRTAEELNGT